MLSPECPVPEHAQTELRSEAFVGRSGNGTEAGSSLVADGKVYVGTRRGELWVFKAGRELHVISTIDLDKPINGTPTAANETLYITTMNRLWAVELK